MHAIEMERCDGAKVSMHVASHTRSFPSFQGTIENHMAFYHPIELFQKAPNEQEFFAADGALWMISFKLECL